MAENITLRDLFSVKGEQLANAPPLGVRLESDTTAIKEQLGKLAKGVPWSGVKNTIGNRVEDLLNVPVIDVLLGGWTKLAKVKEYADPSKHPPGQSNLVPLGEHKVKSVHHPYIEVLVKGRSMGKLVFDIELALTVEGLVLRIEDAAIKSIQSGVLKGDGSISLKGTELARKAFPNIPLPGAVYLGTGLRLS